jgi:predicted HicB family RNase H-like nuclease
MSNVIQFSINGDTNAEKVTDRVKASVSNLEKNMQGIENRFKSFGKDLFLSFAAPMVILNSAINMISSAIEKSRQQVQDALRDAEKGENKYMRAGTITSAQEVARRRQDALDRKNAKLAAEALAEEQGGEGGFAGFGGEADKGIVQYLKESTGVIDYLRRNTKASLMYFGLSSYAKDEEMQKVLEGRATARVAGSPETIAAEAAAKQKQVAEKQIDAQKALESRPKMLDAASGFSNVVGVGANPVLTAISAQLEEQRKQTAILQQIAMGGSYTPPDFTKSATGNPHIDGYGDQM